MVFQVGDAILKAGKDVDVRSVGGQNQRQGGKTRLAVQPRLADGDSGQRVGQVIHKELDARSQKSEYSRQ